MPRARESPKVWREPGERWVSQARPTASVNRLMPARNALLLTAVDCSVVALLVQVQLAGLMNVLGWGLIAVYLGSGLGFLWCAMQVARNGAVRESLSLSKRFALF